LFVNTSTCIIAMASGNSFAALADNDDEVPNQASKKPQAVAGAIPHVSTAGQKGQGKDRQPVISDRVISRHPGGDKPAHSGAGPRRADRQSGGRADAAPARVVLRNCAAGGRTQRVSGSKSDVVKVSSPACVQRTQIHGVVPFVVELLILHRFCFSCAHVSRRPTAATMSQAPPELMQATANLLSPPPPR
jgi:hypothetical protein